MSYQALKDVFNTGLQRYLDERALEVREEHRANAVSWLKTRFRSGNRAASALNAAKTSSSIAGAAFQIEGASISAATTSATLVKIGTATAGAAGVAALASGIGFVAIPAALALYSTGKWASDKAAHNKVNVEIRDWFYENCRDWKIPEGKAVDPVTATRWLAWFGSEGIENMKELAPKLKQAEQTCLAKWKAIIEQCEKFLRLGRASRSEMDAVSSAYLALGKDLQYLQYRLERFVMYPLMLKVAISSYEKGDQIRDVAEQASTFVETLTERYKRMGAFLVNRK